MYGQISDLVQLLCGDLEVLVDRGLEVVLYVESHIGGRLALNDLLGDMMNATELFLEVCRSILCDVFANLGDDIHQESSANNDEST